VTKLELSLLSILIEAFLKSRSKEEFFFVEARMRELNNANNLKFSKSFEQATNLLHQLSEKNQANEAVRLEELRKALTHKRFISDNKKSFLEILEGVVKNIA